jgi:hypothetical protein
MCRPDLSAVAFLFLGLLSGLPALAEDGLTTWKLSQAVEIPSHRWLAKVRKAPETKLAPFTMKDPWVEDKLPPRPKPTSKNAWL